MAEDYTSAVAEVAEAMNAVYENKQTNKKNSLSGDYSSDSASYPTCKAVKDAYGTKKTSWASTPSDSDIPSEKLVKDSLDGKISISQTTGLVKNDGTIDTTTYLTSSSISGKFDTAGTGLTSNGTTISADIGGSSSTSSSKLVACDDSRLSNARTPTSHEQATSTITNSKAFNNILSGESSTLTLTDLDKVLTAIDTKLGILSSIDVVKVTSNKGTASASTMNKLFIEVGQNKTDIYYTTENNSTYSWEKLEDDILEDITVPSDVSDLTDSTGLLLDSSDIQAEISAFASALAEAINPSS